MATALSIIAVSISGLTFLWTIGWSFTHTPISDEARVKVGGSFSIPVYGPNLGEPALGITGFCSRTRA
jgi:hypothetical protein